MASAALNSSGFHLNAKARHEGSYASRELPHFIRDLPYSYPGDPELAALIGEEIRAAGLKSLVHDIKDLGLEYGTLVPMYLMNDREPKMADTAMLFGILGGAGYQGHGEQLCDYFPSTGTGQVVVDFAIT